METLQSWKVGCLPAYILGNAGCAPSDNSTCFRVTDHYANKCSHFASMLSGSHVTRMGKEKRMSVVMISIITNHQAPLKICDKGVLRSIPAITYTFRPTGGVIRPISHILTARMPNQVGSNPSATTVGNMMGRVMTNIEKASRNIPSGK